MSLGKLTEREGSQPGRERKALIVSPNISTIRCDSTHLGGRGVLTGLNRLSVEGTEVAAGDL